jgi:lipopolysaccharide/colanic/teichoic acid biosynthesis glycosyltransferase
MAKRLFDITSSLLGLLLIAPLLLLIALLVVLDSRGGVFYRQVRVGKDNRDFRLLKFRSMAQGSDRKGLLTVGGKDSRVTRTGYYLRKYKLDELPQLVNVLKGDMSLVGPRPEVRKYVSLYDENQLKVLSVRPGITDPASIAYSNENELLGSAENPEKLYIEEIMPAKLRMNLDYIRSQSFSGDVRIIGSTITKIISR